MRKPRVDMNGDSLQIGDYVWWDDNYLWEIMDFAGGRAEILEVGETRVNRYYVSLDELRLAQPEEYLDDDEEWEFGGLSNG